MARNHTTSPLRLLALAACLFAAVVVACKGDGTEVTEGAANVTKIMAVPVPPEVVSAAGVADLERALDAIKTEVPSVSAVWVDFETDTTDRDWVPVLDAIAGRNLKAVVGFVTPEGTPFRPVSTNSGWILGNVQQFFEDARVTGHRALLAVRTISEPWNDSLGLTYNTESMKSLYGFLRGIAPQNAIPKLLVDMGDGFTRKQSLQDFTWSAEMADIVLIRLDPFQDSAYAQGAFTSAQLTARRTMMLGKPGQEVWSSAQVHGDRLPGVGFGPYFPTADELKMMLDDLFKSELEGTLALSAVVFERWDALKPADRGPKVVLSDAVRVAGAPDHAEAAKAAIEVINKWAAGEPEDAGLPADTDAGA